MNLLFKFSLRLPGTGVSIGLTLDMGTDVQFGRWFHHYQGYECASVWIGLPRFLVLGATLTYPDRDTEER